MVMKQHVIAPALLGLTLLGQTGTEPTRQASMNDVVAEIHALRGDLQQMAESSLKTQLLVARLQVEEQRIEGLARQLAETEQQMRALEGARNPMLTQMITEFDKAPREAGQPDMFAGVRAQLEKIENGDPVLNERQASLSRMLAEEQARWTAFNAQLEALEKSFASRR
jgi:hypothetical protein